MQGSSKLFYLGFIFLFVSSCTGIKNVSGTLSKSDENAGSVSKHGDYLGTAAKDSLAATPASYKSSTAEVSNQTYKRDYNKLTETQLDRPSISPISNSIEDHNQKLIDQYADMDRLGDVLLYELDIIDRRWALLLEQFKSANTMDKESISKELDRLGSNQLTLYKAYTRIYKNGKTDWPKVKGEVENTLLSLRGIDKK